MLAVLSGVLLSLAWPLAGFPLLIFIAFVPLFMAEEAVAATSTKSVGRKIWALSYLTFIIWNVLTTWWVYNSTPEGAYLAFGCNSLFMSWVYYCAFKVKQKLGKRMGHISFVVFWLMFEYLHMNWKLSWPWLTLGNVFAAFPQWIQWYEYTGILGGSVWIIVINILLYELLRSFSFKKAVLPLALLILPIALSYGIYFTYTEKSDPVQVAVIQPNIDPYNEKFQNGTQDAQFSKLLRLAYTQSNPDMDYYVFPETSIPFPVWDIEKDSFPEFLALRRFLAQNPKGKIVIGGTYLEAFLNTPPDQIPISATRYRGDGFFYDDYNAAFQIDTSKNIPVYRKSKLVPGPESYPLPDFMKPVQEAMFSEIGGMIGNLGTQKERSVFTAPDNPDLIVGSIICYESIYGEFVTEYVQKGASLLFIITNDGWWGDTPGYKQHFQYARLRAIETRRSIARSANTGSSGFINQRGDILQQTPYAQEDAITATINANHSLTFYVKYGDYIGKAAEIIGIALLLYLVFLSIRDSIKKRRKKA